MFIALTILANAPLTCKKPYDQEYRTLDGYNYSVCFNSGDSKYETWTESSAPSRDFLCKPNTASHHCCTSYGESSNITARCNSEQPSICSSGNVELKNVADTSLWVVDCAKEESSGNNNLSDGEIAGIAVGSVAGVSILVFVATKFCGAASTQGLQL